MGAGASEPVPTLSREEVEYAKFAFKNQFNDNKQNSRRFTDTIDAYEKTIKELNQKLFDIRKARCRKHYETNAIEMLDPHIENRIVRFTNNGPFKGRRLRTFRNSVDFKKPCFYEDYPHTTKAQRDVLKEKGIYPPSTAELDLVDEIYIKTVEHYDAPPNSRSSAYHSIQGGSHKSNYKQKYSRKQKTKTKTKTKIKIKTNRRR